MSVTESVIRVRDGQFGYRGRPVVRADLEIEAGEIVALLGPNGSGKTTLLKGMLGLAECLGGSVELFGSDLRGFDDRSLIGYVPQRQTVVGPIPVTVHELVRSGRLSKTGLVRPFRSGDRRAVSDAIDAVGLTEKTRQPVSTLSGGQQRRALVARALAGGANVLLLDEPFAGVDQLNQSAMAAALRELVPGGATIVVVLHELGPLEPMVTRTICLDGGSVLFDGPLDAAPPRLLHLGHDHDPHGGQGPADGMGLFRR
jgi:zinc transport system ATP-binding protein